MNIIIIFSIWNELISLTAYDNKLNEAFDFPIYIVCACICTCTLSFFPKATSCEEVVEVSLTQECEVDVSIAYADANSDQDPTVTCSTACSSSETQVQRYLDLESVYSGLFAVW